MAVDVYLSIEGIKGESADSKHRGWLECLSVHWGLTQPRSATASSCAKLRSLPVNKTLMRGSGPVQERQPRP